MKYNQVNILIPMAGEGSRFAQAGYADPKPFIDVQGMPMIERVMDNVNMPGARFILVARRAHVKNYGPIMDRLNAKYTIDWVFLDHLTEGTACTVLSAFKKINNEEPLLIANSDQIVDLSMEDFLNDCYERRSDGSILCFQDQEKNPKWSFAKQNEDGWVTEVKEKVAISDLATVGIYFFGKGREFCEGAIEMIVQNDRVNGEFYTCPVYNYLIHNNKKIVTYTIDQQAMHGIGTPEDLNVYLQHIA